MRTVTIKRGDTAITFTDTLRRVVGSTKVAHNLTGSTVLFILNPEDGGTTISQTATIVDATKGKVSYTPVAADVASAGRYRQEWQVTNADGGILTFPNDGDNLVVIIPNNA